MASTSTSTSTSTSKSSTTATATASKSSPLNLSANFAGAHSHSKVQAGNPNAVDYDHEIYLQLTAGEKAKEKTPNQVYREVCALLVVDRGGNVIDVVVGASPKTYDEGFGSGYFGASGGSESG
jgi:hypothetical protein